MMELNKYPLDVQVCTMEVASCKTILYLLSFSICLFLLKALKALFCYSL